MSIAALPAANLLVSASTDALADKRIAFVVGDGAYKNVSALFSPTVDAKSMVNCSAVSASTWWRARTSTRMTEELCDFSKREEGTDVALFFHAGHRIAVNGANYLLPVDAKLKSEADVKHGAVINAVSLSWR